MTLIIAEVFPTRFVIIRPQSGQRLFNLYLSVEHLCHGFAQRAETSLADRHIIRVTQLQKNLWPAGREAPICHLWHQHKKETACPDQLGRRHSRRH
jgi:hypothetical protein